MARCYIAKSNGLYKIGQSLNPFNRVKQLRYDHPDIKLLGYTDKLWETDLHKKYSEYRVYGEWFDFDDNMIKEILKDFHFTDKRVLDTRKPVKNIPSKNNKAKHISFQIELMLKFYSKTEIATYLSISRQALYDLLKSHTWKDYQVEFITALRKLIKRNMPFDKTRIIGRNVIFYFGKDKITYTRRFIEID
jgi:hypothetical protein